MQKKVVQAEPGFQEQREACEAEGGKAWGHVPGRAPSHQGCTGQVQELSSLGTTAVPQSRWPSQSPQSPAGRGQAQGSRRRAAPPRTLRSEETEERGRVRAELG